MNDPSTLSDRGHQEDNNFPASSSQILHALQVIHDPRSPKSLREHASSFLEEFKSNDEAPYHGFSLASDQPQPVVRHYGLSLLENAIRDRWAQYSTEQAATLRGWVVNLAEGVVEADPPYLRNKVAEIWVEVAKRSWALDWMTMDELLVGLWNGPVARKDLVLTILETLSEDVFGREDTVTGLRGTDLNRACVDIFTPAGVLLEAFPNRETSINVRYGEEGWLSRIGDSLRWCTQDEQIAKGQQAHAVAALSALKSVVTWIMPGALVSSRVFDGICTCLAVPASQVRLAAIEVLNNLYMRTRFTKDEFTNLVCPMCRPEVIVLLTQLFESCGIDPSNIDDDRHLISKKFAEMMFGVGKLLEDRPSLVTESLDLSAFFGLLLSVAENQSLNVSISALHLWTKLLSSDVYARLPATTALFGQLLELSSQRLIKYEALPEDSINPSIMILREDLDTMPEKHAFLGNYARFCELIVTKIVEQQPADALYHILGQADRVLEHLYDGEPAFQSKVYSKTSVPVLKIDAQFTVIEAALKGCARWLSHPNDLQNESQQDVLLSNVQTWCERLFTLTFEDPLVIERVIQLAVVIATGPLKRNAPFAFKVFDYTLNTRCPKNPSSRAYDEAVTDLEGLRLHHLQRLAMRFPDYFITVFDEIERRVNAVSHATANDEQTRVRYSSILFIITHRATSIDPAPRQQRLEQFLQPLISQWQSNDLGHSLSSFDSFCQVLGMGGIQQYASSRGIHRIQDWSTQALDDEGVNLQQSMQKALEILPLRATKTILSVSTEKLEPNSRTYNMACELWQKQIPLVLPNLLQLIRLAHAFHDPQDWTNLPPEMSGIVRRFLTDRFWQVGISTGSRDEFYAKVGDTKTTLEGLASSVRATVRAVRETGYRILFYMSLFQDYFYSFGDLPEPLARALFTDACALSTHQMSVLVDMIRPIIEACPAKSRAHFLPPMLTGLFAQLDRKAGAEWDRIEHKTHSTTEDDSLSDEMRDESILRQLTFTSVMLVVTLLEPQKSHPPHPANPPNGMVNDDVSVDEGSMRDYILSTPLVLKPVILFCTHALRMRDTRSCSIITRVLRSIVPAFDGPGDVAAEVREFISTEVLKACITSLHDAYFVDLQKDLAYLIGSIIATYHSKTTTPQQVLLSLPSMTTEKVDRAIHQIQQPGTNARKQRALVLNLLQDLRSVSVSEQGRILRPDPKKFRSAMQAKYITADMDTDEAKGQPSPELGGVADMFK